MFYWDWTMIFVIPGLLLGLWAQMRVSSAFKKYSAVHAHNGMSAEEVARSMLNRSGCGEVSVRTVSGNLTDHYDPRNNTLRLSDGVYGSTSVAAIGVAAHECGHAMQQHEGYAPLKLRSALVPGGQSGQQPVFPHLPAGPRVQLGTAALCGYRLLCAHAGVCAGYAAGGVQCQRPCP